MGLFRKSMSIGTLGAVKWHDRETRDRRAIRDATVRTAAATEQAQQDAERRAREAERSERHETRRVWIEALREAGAPPEGIGAGATRLVKLAGMRDAGVLSEAEFHAAKDAAIAEHLAAHPPTSSPGNATD